MPKGAPFDQPGPSVLPLCITNGGTTSPTALMAHTIVEVTPRSIDVMLCATLPLGAITNEASTTF